MKRIVAALLAGLILSGCASTSRLTSYRGAGIYSDAEVRVKGKIMTITLHPRDNYLLAQVTMGSATMSGLIDGATFGIARGHRLDPRDVDQALARFVAPAGCTMSPARMIGNGQVSFEAAYSCPAGIDLRALMLSQRAELKSGQALRLP